MPRRVRRNREQEEVYRQLTDGESRVFLTYKDAFLMAACIGALLNERESFVQSAEGIDISVFRGTTDIPVIDAIALHATQDVEIIVDEEDAWDRKLTIVEEFANAGMRVLRDNVLNAPGDPLENLVRIIYEQRDVKDESADDVSLEDVVDSLFT